MKYKIFPDIAIFGKALGNGYAINAIIGKKEIMESTKDTFISSTFWTERIGPSAALKTLEIMNTIKSWEIITKIGNKVRLGWKKLAENHNLKISISGIPAISSYIFDSANSLEYKTFLCQEMLKKGFLASTNFYASTSHDNSKIDSYFNALDKVFETISKCENDLLDIKKLLNGPVCHTGFQRLN